MKDATLQEKPNWLEKIGELYDHHRNLMVNPGLDVDENIRKEFIDQSNRKRALQNKFEAIGVKPLAIMPEEAFEQITNSPNFYTFEKIHDENKVYGNGFAVNDFLQKFIKISVNYSVLTTIISYIVLFYLQPTLAKNLMFWSAILGILVYTFLVKEEMFGFIGKLIFSVGCGPFLPLAIIFGLCLYPVNLYRSKFTDRKKLKKLLWPKRNDKDREGAGINLFQLVLPKFPNHVQDILHKCKENGLETFLVLDYRSFDVVVDRKKIRELYSEYDPIICYKEKRMVAALCQFGDFPEEKEMVAEMADYFSGVQKSLLKKNLN